MIPNTNINHIKSTIDQLVISIAGMLGEIIVQTDLIENSQKTIFHSRKRPLITLENYMLRLSKYTGCSEECYVLALIYMDRLQDIHQHIVLNSFCVHRFLMTSILCAIKWQDDDYYKNTFYAKVGGIPLSELNILEQEFLNLLDFQIYVDPKLFTTYSERLKQFIEL